MFLDFTVGLVNRLSAVTGLYPAPTMLSLFWPFLLDWISVSSCVGVVNVSSWIHGYCGVLFLLIGSLVPPDLGGGGSLSQPAGLGALCCFDQFGWVWVHWLWVLGWAGGFLCSVHCRRILLNEC